MVKVTSVLQRQAHGRSCQFAELATAIIGGWSGHKKNKTANK